MAKKEAKSQQAAPVETVSGVELAPTGTTVEYQFVAANDSLQLLMQVNVMASMGWRVIAIVDRPAVFRAWLERGRG